MLIYKLKKEITSFLQSEKNKGRSVGFVPTMGALHEGHLSLIRASLQETDITVCSIFVNPAQFNVIEDFTNYPRKTELDLKLLETEGCHCVFMPENEEMYEPGPGDTLKMNFGIIENVCEGKYRPGHFNGVGLIVAKLFNIIQPDRVYFGQKDLQQIAVINKLIKDLSYKLTLRRIPTLREADGLAMSSRNLRIASVDRGGAVIFYNALIKAKISLLNGIPVEEIKKDILKQFENDRVYSLEYLELVEYEHFEVINEYKGQDSLAFCIAGYARNIRLIDNILIND
jgi:pantoate--beta-alanine ligase